MTKYCLIVALAYCGSAPAQMFCQPPRVGTPIYIKADRPRPTVTESSTTSDIANLPGKAFVKEVKDGYSSRVTRTDDGVVEQLLYPGTIKSIDYYNGRSPASGDFKVPVVNGYVPELREGIGNDRTVVARIFTYEQDNPVERVAKDSQGVINYPRSREAVRVDPVAKARLSEFSRKGVLPRSDGDRPGSFVPLEDDERDQMRDVIRELQEMRKELRALQQKVEAKDKK